MYNIIEYILDISATLIINIEDFFHKHLTRWKLKFGNYTNTPISIPTKPKPSFARHFIRSSSIPNYTMSSKINEDLNTFYIESNIEKIPSDPNSNKTLIFKVFNMKSNYIGLLHIDFSIPAFTLLILDQNIRFELNGILYNILTNPNPLSHDENLLKEILLVLDNKLMNFSSNFPIYPKEPKQSFDNETIKFNN